MAAQVIRLPGIEQPALCTTPAQVSAVIDPLRTSADPVVVFFFANLRPGWETRIPPEGIQFSPPA